jgi:hypothetical protein
MLFASKKAKKTIFPIYFNLKKPPPFSRAKAEKLPCRGKLPKNFYFPVFRDIFPDTILP